MTEFEYKQKYGDSDDYAKHYREEPQFKCMGCSHLFNQSELIVGRGLCDGCLKEEMDYLINNEN